MEKVWTLKKVGEVLKTAAGGTPLKSVKEYYENGEIPWLLSGEVNNFNITESKNFITEKGLKNSSARIYPANSVLVAMYGATAGQVGILRFEAASNQAVCAIFPNDNFIPEFVYYFFLSKKSELISKAVGNAQPNISQIKIKETEIPFLPLSEQKAIVEKLDTAFDLIERAKANIEKNIQNAKELFQSKLFSIFTTGETKYTYVSKKFEDICILQRGFDLPTRLRNPGSYPLVSSNGITDKISQFKVKGPGVTTGRSGTIGKVHYITGDFWPLNTSLYIKDFKNNYEKYIYYFLQSVDLSKYASGAGVPTLNRNFIHSEIFKIVDDPSDQKSIVVQLDELFVQRKLLVEKYQQKLANLEELKKCILEKAFKGEQVH